MNIYLFIPENTAELGCMFIFEFTAHICLCSVNTMLNGNISHTFHRSKCSPTSHKNNYQKKKKKEQKICWTHLSWSLPISAASADFFDHKIIAHVAGACDPVFSFYLVSSMVPGKKLKQALWHSPYFMCTAGKGQFKKMHFHSCTASCLPEIQPAFLLEKEQTVASLFFSFPVVFGITHYYYENIATYALL